MLHFTHIMMPDAVNASIVLRHHFYLINLMYRSLAILALIMIEKKYHNSGSFKEMMHAIVVVWPH